jgi:mono/diheme cytochrome c family protein
LTQLAAGGAGDLKALATSVATKLDWAGKPQPIVTVAPLTAEEEKRFAAGREVYGNLCVACHQPDGRGREKVAPTLVESRYATGDAGAPTRVVLGGKEGPVGLMPPLKDALSDEQIASVLTYIRREWGNTGSAVDPDDVREIRQITRSRARPWTDEELLPAGRGGGGRAGGGGGRAGGGGRGQ